MVVIGMASIPLTMLISQSLDQLARIAESNARAAAVETAISAIAPINPLDRPTGQIEMGELAVLWTSSVLVEPNENIQLGSGLGGFKLGFYNVQVEMLREDVSWFTFSLRKVGYDRRDVSAILAGGN